jgi:hypothetical protein
MVRIAITVEAFEAVRNTVPLGSVGYENGRNTNSGRFAAMVDPLFPPSGTVLCSARRG